MRSRKSLKRRLHYHFSPLTLHNTAIRDPHNRGVARTAIWAGLQRLPRTPPTSGNPIALASAKLGSLAGSGSGALQYAESWATPRKNEYNWSRALKKVGPVNLPCDRPMT